MSKEISLETVHGFQSKFLKEADNPVTKSLQKLVNIWNV